ATNHWETSVFANDTWSYFEGISAPPAQWQAVGFDDAGWKTGQGGIGYGDGDDATQIGNTLTLYMRMSFNVSDPGVIANAVLHADYDDAFVAYINGVEIARSAIGTPGVEPPFDQAADNLHEAVMYTGGMPEEFLIDTAVLNQTVVAGENVLAIQVHNQNISSSDLSAIFFLSFGVNVTGTYFRPVPGWFSPPTTFESSNLPIVFIDTQGRTIPGDPRIKAHMGIVYNGNGVRNFVTDSLNNYNGDIGIEVRGSSSQMFPKKSFRVETQDSLGLNNNVSLLGMPRENDWVLYAPYTDKTLIRNMLAYEISRKMGHYAPRMRLCELLLNGTYQGVYLLTETVKRDSGRVNIASLRDVDIAGDELTGGYIFKVDRPNPQGGNWTTQHYSPNDLSQYSIVYPKPQVLKPEQFNYITDFVQRFESAVWNGDLNDPNSGYPAMVDEQSFMDFFLVNEITKNVDGYRLSTYYYKEKDSNGGKLHAGPVWDFNLGFGNADYCEGDRTNGWAYRFNYTCNSDQVPFYWEKIRGSERFVELVKERWANLRSSFLHTDSVFQDIDSLVAVLDEAQQRNFKKWPTLGTYVWPNPFVGATYQEEIQYLKDWIFKRLEFLDGEIENMAPIYNYNELLNYKTRAFPNPFSTDITLQYALYKSGKTAIRVYNRLGQAVYFKNLGFQKAGYYKHTWNGTDNYQNDLSKGIYLVEIVTDSGRRSVTRVVKF
ncbi:MAG: CotH kinase family protein, partial [Cyclobacteriaceae bacterium]|nr:CotH kinase family protein [Cyclobacteriaceae bacterium]